MWWWDTRLGAGSFTDSIATLGRVSPQRGTFHVVDTSGGSYNAAGVVYTAIAVFDPAARFVLPFTATKAQSEDDFTQVLRHPQTRAVASTFTPDFVFGGAALANTNDSVRASLYRGPGHSGDLTATLGTTQASSPNFIQAVGPGTVELGSAVGRNGGDMAFWAGRVSDGVSPTRLMAVTSYVGDGTASRTVPLNLSGEAPRLVLVVPTSSAARVYRLAGDTTGRNTTSGTAVANSLTALAADQVTVGTALNATGVTYGVWAITTGTIPPQ